VTGVALALAERVRELIAPLFATSAVELVDVEHVGGALRVVVDQPGGVDLDTVTQLTRQVSRLLDVDDPVAGGYTLEVSTPGLERRLRTPDHFVRAVGTAVRVKTRPEVEGERRLTGVLAAADDDGIVVRPDLESADPERRLRYDEIESARTVFEWGPAPKPGAGSKPGAARATKPASKKKQNKKKMVKP